MKIEMVCATWMDEDDEKVVRYLSSCDDWPSVEEIARETGVRERKVKLSLDSVRRQIGFIEARKKLLSLQDD